MTRLALNVDLQTLQDSNRFLRALWAQLRAKFGRAGWIYQPYRDGESKTVHFGSVSLGRRLSFDVSITYVKRGTIKEIIFEDRERNLGSLEDRQLLTLCVRTAEAEFRQPKDFQLQAPLRLARDVTFHPYQTKMFALTPSASGYVWFAARCTGYDLQDATHWYRTLAHTISDLLAAFTNVMTSCKMARGRRVRIGMVEVNSLDELDEPETEEKAESEPPPIFHDEANVHWFPDNWLEGGPYIEDRLALSRSQVALIDAVLEGRVRREMPILRAARHFNEGLEFHDTTTDHPEAATTLLVSACNCSTWGEDGLAL
jgi:hypothetical protein